MSIDSLLREAGRNEHRLYYERLGTNEHRYSMMRGLGRSSIDSHQCERLFRLVCGCGLDFLEGEGSLRIHLDTGASHLGT